MATEQLTFGEKVIAFNKNLHFPQRLPEGIRLMNPFRETPQAVEGMTQFYRKFYHDYQKRKFMIGINPGRFGAGITGVPFTDTKHLDKDCGIPFPGEKTHEPSATFVYKMIEYYGGVKAFYKDIYINSIFPLTIIRKNKKGNFVNCNYYDDKNLTNQLKPFMIRHLIKQIDLGLDTEKAFVLGKKNATFIEAINKEIGIFKELIVMEHPRYVQQYKSKESGDYAQKFVGLLRGANPDSI